MQNQCFFSSSDQMSLVCIAFTGNTHYWRCGKDAVQSWRQRCATNQQKATPKHQHIATNSKSLTRLYADDLRCNNRACSMIPSVEKRSNQVTSCCKIKICNKSKKFCRQRALYIEVEGVCGVWSVCGWWCFRWVVYLCVGLSCRQLDKGKSVLPSDKKWLWMAHQDGGGDWWFMS